MSETRRTTGSGSWRSNFNRKKVYIRILKLRQAFVLIMFRAHIILVTDGISKRDHETLQASATKLKKRLESSDWKLKKLATEKVDWEKKLSDKNVELEELKVKCD